jgi:ribosome-binding ATPase YchF (GTP1/OBG family)
MNSNSTVVTDLDTIRFEIREAIQAAMNDAIPSIIRRASAKEWMTKDEVLEMTGWSDRTLQYMRTSRQIPFSKHNRKIMYPTDGIEQFLTDHNVLPYGKKKGVKP